MPRKLCIKKLTDSDLTFFEWQFRNRNAGNQKAINLNANVFADQLYPGAADYADAHDYRIHIELAINGPGIRPELTLARKIIKGEAYKNWRLDGEFVHNPSDEPDRFNALEADDYAILEFTGGSYPTACRAVFVAAGVADDAPLHDAVRDFMGNSRMKAVSFDELNDLVDAASPAPEHPVHGFLLEDALEDAAFGGIEGTETLLRRPSGRRMTSRDLVQARAAAGRTGDLGEALVNHWMEARLAAGEVDSFDWVSQDNAVSPYDFQAEEGGVDVHIDVKATGGPFSRKFHVSLNELRDMATHDGRYDLYRVYDASPDGGKLRVTRNLRPWAEGVIRAFDGLPGGVTPDSVSVDPATLDFEDEQPIEAVEETNE